MSTSIETIQGIYQAFARGDASALLGALDPTAQWHEAENSMHSDLNPYIGPDSVGGGLLQRLAEDLEDFTVAPERFIDAGDTVVVQGRYQCTVRSTGQPVNAQFAHVWDLMGGRIVRFQQYTDTKQWADAAITPADANSKPPAS